MLEKHFGDMSHELRELEMVERSKIGPFRRSAYADYAEDVHSYFNVPPLNQETVDHLLNSMSTEAVTRFHYEGMVSSIIPTNLTEALKNAKRNTNLGLPAFTSNWKPEILKDYVGRAASLLRGGDAPLYPFVLFHRSQPKGPDEWKDRVVWGADHAETFLGLCYLKPFLESMSQAPEMAAWKGIDWVDESLRRAMRIHPYTISLDFSGFDKTISPSLMHLGVTWLSKYVAPSYREPLLKLGSFYSSGALVTPEGVISGIHGMPSGVALTNLIDTVVNMIISIQVIFDTFGIPTWSPMNRHRTYQFHGDDAVICLPHPVTDSDLTRLVNCYEKYGLKVSASKTYIGEESCHYLQRLWTPQESAVMSTMRVLGRLLYTERRTGLSRFMDTGEFGTEATDETRRNVEALIGVMKIENCNKHPLFDMFVWFVQNSNKDLLTLSAIDKSSRAVDEARGYKFISD